MDKELINAIYFDEPFDHSKLDQWLPDSVAYLRIPAMFSYETHSEIESYLIASIEKYRDAKAFIIDLRGNGGGTRDIFKTFAGYLVRPKESPWLANVAYIRNNQQIDEDIQSMSSRYLYSYDSEMFDDEDRRVIDSFKMQFETAVSIDSTKFSRPYYMILRNNGRQLDCPVYIMIDETSFSAASVFAAAVKGLSNVTLVGNTTNGSSGRSREFYLSHSNIRVKLSTMISLQRYGKTLDGNGTEPDMVLDRDESHIFAKRDSQLADLLDIIRRR